MQEIIALILEQGSEFSVQRARGMPVNAVRQSRIAGGNGNGEALQLLSEYKIYMSLIFNYIYYYISFFMSLVDIPVGFGGLFKWIASVYDRL